MADKRLILSKTKLYINHPIPGQLFADIFPIFRSPTATEAIISHLTSHLLATHALDKIAAIVCLESRGFFFAPLIASRLGLPCVPVRKKGKLPGEVISETFEKDYGPDVFEMKTDAFEGVTEEGGSKKIILVDDLLGKGGSIMAAKVLVEKLGMEVAEAVFIFDVDIPDYNEAVKKNLGDLPRYAMVTLNANNLGSPVNI